MAIWRPGRRDDAPDDGVVPEVDPVLGTLRSELDDDAAMPELFDTVHARTTEIRHAVSHRQMTREQAARELSGLRIAAPDGTLWAVGARSLNWFRKLPGGSWARHVPPLGGSSQPFELAGAVAPDQDEREVDITAPESDDSPDSPTDTEVTESTDAAPRDSFDALLEGLGELDQPRSAPEPDADTYGDGLDEALRRLPGQADDPDRDPGPSLDPLDLPSLVEPGSSLSDTDDALGDEGRLSDDELNALLGLGGPEEPDAVDGGGPDDPLDELRALGEQLQDPGPSAGDPPADEVGLGEGDIAGIEDFLRSLSDEPGDADEQDSEHGYGSASGSGPRVVPDWALEDDDEDDDLDDIDGYGA